MASYKLVGGGVSYLRDGTNMVHRSPFEKINLTNGRPLYCTRVGDNEFPVPAYYKHFYRTRGNLQFFRWGGDNESFNSSDMRDFKLLLATAEEKRGITGPQYTEIVNCIRRPTSLSYDNVVRMSKDEFTFSYAGDSRFSSAVIPLFNWAGYAGWVRDLTHLTEYMFINPAADLIPVSVERAEPPPPPARAPQADDDTEPEELPDKDAGKGSGLPDRGSMFHMGLNRRTTGAVA
jgi:hypothetical protein